MDKISIQSSQTEVRSFSDLLVTPGSVALASNPTSPFIILSKGVQLTANDFNIF